MDKYLKASDNSNENDQFPAELRYDVASKDWVVIASGRAKRPETFKSKERQEKSDPEDCPFCKKETYSQLVEVFNQGEKLATDILPKEWTTVSIPNKFPAFIPAKKLDEKEEGGLYKKVNAVGYHEVIITKDHYKSLGQLSLKKVSEVLTVYKNRYLDLMDRTHVNHISIFHNHGKEAGASIDHPHSQLITTPLIDKDLSLSLKNSKEYKQEKGSCLYCDMQKWEIKKDERVVYQNDEFLVLCPFASKVAFQMIVTPKRHFSNFEKINEKQLTLLADAFKEALSKLYEGLNNPAYNFYLHTAPCDGKNYDHYHWHWTIFPKTSVFMGGFELGSQMEISTIKPEDAAKHLKNI